MKPFVVTFFFFVNLLLIHETCSAQIPTNGLIAYYSFNGNANDASGNGNDGILQNGIAFGKDRFGIAGSAASFDGIDDYISVNSSVTLESPSTSITITNWIKVSGSKQEAYYLAKTDRGTYNYRCGLFNEGMYLGKAGSQTNAYLFNENNPFPSTVWKMLSYTFDGQNVKFYMDGQLVKTIGDSPIISTSNVPLEIGRDAHGPIEWFQGEIDDVRIYNRALSDSEIQAIYQTEVPPVYLQNLAESINNPPYKVPREATIHHYFLSKTTNNLPLEGEVINYTLSSKPDVIRQSLPSEADGLIDLNIKVGGDDPITQADDWQGMGTVSVNFHSLASGKPILANAFASTPFSIQVVDKAEPIDREMGIGLGFKVGNSVFDAEEKNKAKVGNTPLNLKMSVGLKLGASADAYVKIKPTNQPKVWKVYFNAGIGSDIGGKVEYGVNFRSNMLGVGGLSTEFNVSDGIRLESGYEFNLNNKQELYKLAALIFKLNSGNTAAKELSTIFGNLADKAEPIIKNISYSSAFAYGAGFDVNANVRAGGKILALNLEGYGNIPEASMTVDFNAKGNFNDNLIFEVEKDYGRHITNTIDVGIQANADYIAIGELTKGNRKNNPTVKSQQFSFFNEDIEKNISVTKSFRYSDSNPRSPHKATVSFSTRSLDLDLLPNKKHNIVYNNAYKFGTTSFLYLFPVITNPVPSSIQLNPIAQFLTDQNNSLVIGNVVSNGLAGNMYDQAYRLNLWMTANAKQNNLPLDEIEYRTDREISLVNKTSRPLSIPRLESKLFSVELNSWKTYKHDLRKAYYVKSLDRTLLTLDYPEITSNLLLPEEDPIEEINNAIKNAVANELQNWLESAQAFLTKILTVVDQTADLIYTNWGLPRKSVSGIMLYDPKAPKPIADSNAPSVFTFTIPKTSFETSTKVEFKYFYPDNEIKAICETDTFRIISDIFSLSATADSLPLSQTPNGPFSIQTEFSANDLMLASLPANSVPVVLFQPHGSDAWIEIGNANAVIPFSLLGNFGLGVKISNDNVSPDINVLTPTSYQTPHYFEITLSDNKSGIDWAKTSCIVNSKKMDIVRTGNSGTFRIAISDVPIFSNGIFYFSVSTADLAGNSKSYANIYPCNEYHILQGLDYESDNPVLKKALYFVESTTKIPLDKGVILKAGKKIELKPGFETSNGFFKAEIGGCAN